MKKNIQKSIAMPPKFFGAPMELAAANIGIQLPLALFIQTFSDTNPLYICCSILFFHIVFILFGLKMPHLSKILEAYGKTKSILIDKYDLDNATLLFKDNSFVCVFKMAEDVLLQQMPVKYMDGLASLKINLRMVNVRNANYLILSGKKHKNNVAEAVEQTKLFFHNIELLTKNTYTTPVDIVSSILNPIASASVVVPSHLSEKTFIINQRSLFKKDVMLFEQGGQKLYTTVLSLSNLNDCVDFDVLAIFKQRFMVLSWVLPYSFEKASCLMEQQRRMSRLCFSSASKQKVYLDAMEQVQNGEVFCQYGVNVCVSAPSLQQLEMYKKEVIATAKQYGLFFVEEEFNLPFSFYVGLPQYEASRRFLLPSSVISV